MFCTNCGKEVADGSLFCTSCGNKLASVAQPEPAAEVPAVTPETVSNEIAEVPETQEITDTAPVIEASAPETNTAPVTYAEPVQAKPAVAPAPVVSASSVVPPKKSNKGIVYAIGAVAVIIILVLLFSGGGKGGYSDYKTLVKDYYNAINKKDANAIVKMFDKDIQKELKDSKDDIKDTLDEMKSTYDDEYDKGWYKQVKAASRDAAGKGHYAVNVELDGDAFDILYIKKVDDKYFLDEDNSVFY